ncbi:MAG: response regulator [Chitinophagaceae bacterium]
MNLKVLIVDDDPMVIFIHKVVVVDSGLSTQPITAHNGKEALEYINGHMETGSLFLILLDINMPVMNGWEFLDSIQSMYFSNQLTVAIVTSSCDSRDRKKAEQYPQVAGYFEKPLDTDACNEIKHWKNVL